MPAEARGHVRKLPSGKWQLRCYDRKGPRAIEATTRRLPRRDARRPRAHDGRARGIRVNAARPLRLLSHVGTPAGVRGGRALRLLDPKPGQARWLEPDACITGGSRL